MILRRLLWCLLLLLAPLAGAAELRLAGSETQVPLAALMEAYEDKSGIMDIDDVVHQGRFSTQPQLMNPGYTHSAIWLKIKLINDAAAPLTRWIAIQPGRLREAGMFVRQGGHWQRIDAGNQRPFAQHPVPATSAVFPLQLAPGEVQTAYFRIATPLDIEIKPTLWEPLAFRERENQARLVDGSMLGGLFVTTIFGLLMLLMLRDRAFLFNALATLTFCLGEASAKGYSFMYLWPNATEWATRSLPLFALFGVGLNVLFLRELLATHANFPRIDRVLLTFLAIQWLPLFGILFGDFAAWSKFSFAVNFPATVMLALVGTYAMTKGIHAARYYTAAYAGIAIGSLLRASVEMGLDLPAESSEYALPIAMLLSNTLMLASVINRIMLATKEKEAAQDALHQVRSTHEARLVRAVEERTADLHAALAETRAANRTRSRLLAYIGHDLRAPLATIVNYVHLLRRRDDADAHRYHATIERSALHQLELIDDLMEYARGELDRLELVPVPTYLHDWLENVASQAELLAGQQNNRLFLDADDRLPPVVVFDPKRLRQVLINLLGNAAKFTRKGKIRLGLHAISLAETRIELAFAVEDSGSGIPREDMDRIFLPFERRESEREGFGLGLSIARHLVRAMGGELQVESTLGKGSRFSFRLALNTADEADVAQPVPAFAFPPPFGSGKTLLVADDNAASRDYLREVLCAADFDVICAGHGEEALHLARERRIDAILVDQNMPGIGGWELLRKLHEAHPGAVPPVVLCSAMPPQRPAEYPEGLDFDASLLKPVAADTLLRTMQELSGQPDRCAAPPAGIPAAMLDPLRQMIADGSLSEIEAWSAMLKSRHPEFADFASRVLEAALRIDFAELAALAK